MTQTKRIFLNVVATYGRSLYSLALGLFSARWLLASLGKSDYGLYGLIGGITVFMTFMNSMFANAISRFYAVSVGKASVSGQEVEGLEDCRRWFNTAVSIHTVLPFCLLMVGYPIGEWAVRHWLTIPFDRIAACVWVFRFSCVSCLISMVNVPFNAMYVAKQYIAELTVYSLLSTTGNFLILWYMVLHPQFWLVKYSLAIMLLGIVPQFLICMRALKTFPECRITRRYLWNGRRFKELFCFAFWNFFAWLGNLSRTQGLAVMVNKTFGPVYNASMAVANSVAAHTDSLSAALHGAFSPAIANCAGAGNRARMLSMAYRSTKIGLMLCLVFAIPIMFEIDALLVLWLKSPPPLSGRACYATLGILVIDQTLKGVNLSIDANGRIGLYNFSIGSIYMTLPIAAGVIQFFAHTGFLTAFYTLFAYKIIIMAFALLIARIVVGYSVFYWLRQIIMPTVIVVAVTVCGVWTVRNSLMDACLSLRLAGVVLVTEALLFPLFFCFILDDDERRFFTTRVSNVWQKIRRRG